MSEFKDINELFQKGVYADLEVIIHKPTGYINGTKLCKQNNSVKPLRAWFGTKSSKIIIEEMTKDIGKNVIIDDFQQPDGKLIDNNTSGTYLHPRLTTCVILWNSPNMSLNKNKNKNKNKNMRKKKIIFKNNCPTYTINLDKPVEERWNHVINDFKDKIPLAIELVDEIMGPILKNSVITLLGISCKTGMVIYSKELQGISKQTGISVGKVLLLQLAYEAFAACTSVVVNGSKHPIHIRTMDWDLPQLKELTINVIFKKKGKVLFHGTTWAGYIGILTGMKPNAFSVSINYRTTKQCDNNPIRAFSFNIYRYISGCWPIGYLVREILINQKKYLAALWEFRNSELISPTYITLCGIKKNEGAIIRRNRSSKDCINGNIITYLKDGNLIQANMDHYHNEKIKEKEEDDWQDIFDSRFRYKYVRLALDEMKGDYNTKNLSLMMATDPCYSTDMTIYTSLMIPASKVMRTWTKLPRGSRTLGKRKFKDVVSKARKNTKYTL